MEIMMTKMVIFLASIIHFAWTHQMCSVIKKKTKTWENTENALSQNESKETKYYIEKGEFMF